MNISNMISSYMFTLYAGNNTSNSTTGPNFRDYVGSHSTSSSTAVTPKDVSHSAAGKAVVEDAQVKISTLGKATNSVAEVQKANKAMQETSKIESYAQAKQAAENFITAFNQQRDTLTNGSSDDKALVANLAKSQQNMTLESGDSLAAIGISVKSDGSLALDKDKLEQAFNSNQSDTLIQFGRVGAATADMTRAQEREIKLTSDNVLNNVMEFGVQKGQEASNPNQVIADKMAEAQNSINHMRQVMGGILGYSNDGPNVYKSIQRLFG